MKTFLNTLGLCLFVAAAHAQSISPAGIYGASNTGSSGGITVSWVLGTMTPASMSVLPVTLVSFKAKLTENGDALLEWKTAQETNNAGCEVEKSTDGKHFEKIGFIDGKGNAASENSYQFVDKQLTTSSYYRLKQIDMDGTYTHSRIVVVIPSKESIGHLLAYPNPSADGKIDVRLPDKVLSASLVDQQGRIIKTWANPRGLTRIILPATGVYMLKVNTPLESGSVKLIRSE